MPEIKTKDFTRANAQININPPPTETYTKQLGIRTKDAITSQVQAQARPQTDSESTSESAYATDSVYNTTEQVRRNMGLSITDTQVEQILNGKTCSVPENVHAIIKMHGRKYVENIISAVAECGFDLKALPVIIIGGGASIMHRYIRQEDSLCRPICKQLGSMKAWAILANYTVGKKSDFIASAIYIMPLRSAPTPTPSSLCTPSL